jgi:hypothetical protein
MTNLLISLGAAVMWLLRVQELKSALPEECTMLPSEGRSFINLQHYDPDTITRMSSENYEATHTAATPEVVVLSENPTAE